MEILKNDEKSNHIIKTLVDGFINAEIACKLPPSFDDFKKTARSTSTFFRLQYLGKKLFKYLISKKNGTFVLKPEASAEVIIYKGTKLPIISISILNNELHYTEKDGL